MSETSVRVVLCVCGGIAAYKAIEVLRLLQQRGCEVRVACTEEALNFVGAATWEGLTHGRVASSLFNGEVSPIPHIELAGWAQVVLVIPATANIMAKMATGIADDLVSSTLLAMPSTTPVVVAPAMNVHMWQAPATQANVRTLMDRGARFVLPVKGRLACNDVGKGKLAPIDQIAQEVLCCVDGCARDFEGKKVVITAGPTHEAIDPVRYISNASSGKMGYAIARCAALRGAQVTLVSGPVALEAPFGVNKVSVVSAAQMHEAAIEAFKDADVAICAAAVADYTPVAPADHKLKKAHEHLETIELKETVDILASLSASRKDGGTCVVGFAAETNDLIQNATKKLARKGCDIIVANDVSRPDSTFGSDTNRVSFVTSEGVDEQPTLSKREVANRLLDRVLAIMEKNGANACCS